MDNSYSCRLPSRLSEVPGVRERFERATRDLGVPDAEIDVWKLILTELLNNSIEHGCAGPNEQVVVRWVIEADRIEVAVTDPSEGNVDEESFAESDAGDFTITGRGAGLFLIREFSDEVRVEDADDGGTTVVVIKSREVAS